MIKTILLSAGLGERLRPLTNNTPKPLMIINDKSLLSIWLENLSSQNFGPFLINSHYLHKQIENFVSVNELKNKITLVYEKNLEGTAGTLIKNIDFLNEGGLLIHADNYCEANFNKFLEAHNRRPKSCLMTMMTFRTSQPDSCGIVKLDNEGRVKNFFEKNKSENGNLANGAIYILSKEMINEIKENFMHCSDFSNDILPYFMGRIFTYETDKPLIDIGTIEKYNLACMMRRRYLNER